MILPISHFTCLTDLSRFISLWSRELQLHNCSFLKNIIISGYLLRCLQDHKVSIFRCCYAAVMFYVSLFLQCCDVLLWDWVRLYLLLVVLVKSCLADSRCWVTLDTGGLFLLTKLKESSLSRPAWHVFCNTETDTHLLCCIDIEVATLNSYIFSSVIILEHFWGVKACFTLMYEQWVRKTVA